MYYNVAQLLKQGVGATRHYAIDGNLDNIDDYNPGPVPVTGEVTLLRTGSGILAQGTVRMSLTAECRRCLEPGTREVEIEFEEEYTPSIDIETGLKLPQTDVEPELAIDEHHTLDLTEVLRQYAVVAQAEGALCQEDCRGLCPECGANLNLGPCTCTQERVDPRLAELSKLLKSEDQTDTTT